MPPQKEPSCAEGQPGRQRNQHPGTGVEFEHRRDVCDGSCTHELQQYSRAASMVSFASTYYLSPVLFKRPELGSRIAWA